MNGTSLYIPFFHSSLHFHPKRCKSTTLPNWQTLLSNQVSIPLPPFHAHYHHFAPALVSCCFFNHFKLTFFVLHSPSPLSHAHFCCCFHAHFHHCFHAHFHCHLMPFPLSFYTSFIILSHWPLFHLSSLCASNSYP